MSINHDRVAVMSGVRRSLELDRRQYVSARSAARDSIVKLRADHIKTKLDEVSGDVGATWRAAQYLLHNNQKDVFSDNECTKLVSTLCKFFVDRINRIRSNIAVTLQSTVGRAFTDRPYFGPALSSFQPVTTEEVYRLLSAMPSKSPLDVLPCSLLKTCTDTFSPVIAKLANYRCRLESFRRDTSRRKYCDY